MSKKLLLQISVIGSLLIAAAAGATWYQHERKIYPGTDDAYVKANIVNIAAQVSGPVIAVYVHDHETVKKDQLLCEILPTNYVAALKQAIAARTQAENSAKRTASLVKSGHASPSTNDDAQTKLASATAAVEQAQLNLQFTRITAPASGTLINFNVRVGSSITQGNMLFALIEAQQWWIDANYKETQLVDIRPGQIATIKLDMYPKQILKGTVAQISHGSGSAFSLLPFENATGNWIKVTQRFTVKIIIKTVDSTEYPLRVGASASVTIDTRK